MKVLCCLLVLVSVAYANLFAGTPGAPSMAPSSVTPPSSVNPPMPPTYPVDPKFGCDCTVTQWADSKDCTSATKDVVKQRMYFGSNVCSTLTQPPAKRSWQYSNDCTKLTVWESSSCGKGTSKVIDMNASPPTCNSEFGFLNVSFTMSCKPSAPRPSYKPADKLCMSTTAAYKKGDTDCKTEADITEHVLQYAIKGQCVSVVATNATATQTLSYKILDDCSGARLYTDSACTKATSPETILMNGTCAVQNGIPVMTKLSPVTGPTPGPGGPSTPSEESAAVTLLPSVLLAFAAALFAIM